MGLPGNGQLYQKKEGGREGGREMGSREKSESLKMSQFD